MKKRGISTIVATVLIILITVAAVTIVWVAVMPMIKENVKVDEMVDLNIDTAGGYTVWDNETKIACVQIKRGSDEENMTGVSVVFSVEGNSYSYDLNAPEPNQKMTSCFNLSGIGMPDSVGVYPIFVGGQGAVSSTGDFKKGVVDNETNITSGVDAGWLNIYYKDADGDGFGLDSNTIEEGELPAGFAEVGGDCNDASNSTYPGADESYNNGVDEDCDGYDNLNACGELTINNTVYKLDNDLDVEVGENCFRIENADNITLDLGGNTLNGQKGMEFWGCWDNFWPSPYNCTQYTDYDSCNNPGDACGWNSSCVSIGENQTECNNSGCYWTQKCYPDAWESASTQGVYIRYSNDITVKNGDMETFNQGVYLYRTNNSIIEGISSRGYNNSWGGFSGQGVYLYYSSKNQISQLISNNNSQGVYFYKGHENNITDSMLNNNNYGIQLYYSESNQVFNNEIKSNTYIGVYNYRGDYNNFMNNDVCGNTGGSGTNYDFRCYSSNGLSFSSNKCSAINGCSGLTCSSC